MTKAEDKRYNAAGQEVVLDEETGRYVPVKADADAAPKDTAPKKEAAKDDK